MSEETVNQNRPPNFREDGHLYLVRCFACAPEHGRENWALAVGHGYCAWCGWGADAAALSGSVATAEEMRAALDAIIWMSGSNDFGPDGEGHEHWLKVRDEVVFPLLARLTPASA